MKDWLTETEPEPSLPMRVLDAICNVVSAIGWWAVLFLFGVWL